MRERILTDAEKQAIREFLKTRKSSGLIRTLRYRAKKFLPVIEKEIGLLKRLLES